MDRGGSHTPAALAAIAALIIASGGCFQDKVGPLLPCPSGGISVALVDTGPPPAAPPNWKDIRCSNGPSLSLTCAVWSCRSDVCTYRTEFTHDHVANFPLYGCDKPQICPDMSLQAVRQEIGAGAVNLLFLITNCSTGNQNLQIDKVVVYGDDRCSFSNVTDADISPKSVPPGQIAAIRIAYNPGAVGEDFAELGVMSNAQNSSELRLRMCGLATSSSFKPDGGWPMLRCKAQTSRAACHK